MTQDNDTEITLPQRSLAPLKAGANIEAIVPTTVEEAYRLAVAIIKAGLAPDSYNSADGKPDPQKILIGILKSLEVGLPPITGLSQIAIINNRPSLWGDGALALVQRTGLLERVEQHFDGLENPGEVTINNFPDDFRAIYTVWRKGHANPYEGVFSVRDARRAHLWANPRKPIWMQYPRRMLMARARAYALREGFSDALSGLAFREELEDLAPPPPAVDVSFLDAPKKAEALPAPEPARPLPVEPAAPAAKVEAVTSTGDSPGPSATGEASAGPRRRRRTREQIARDMFAPDHTREEVVQDPAEHPADNTEPPAEPGGEREPGEEG